MEVINWVKKLIPGYIEIRSLYWVQHTKKMNSLLLNFDFIIKNEIKKRVSV
jgi:hypothetical protein